MIRIGLNDTQKQNEITSYVATHGIDSIYVFAPDEFKLALPDDYPAQVQYVGYKDIIMYKTFYPLLERINKNSLLVFNECLRTSKRQDLTYNCAHHYCGQTPHKIVFEYFPFISCSDETMILLDLIDKGRFKGHSFNYEYLNENLLVSPVHITYSSIDAPITDVDKLKYQNEAQKLFSALSEDEDVETIPRQLEIFVGRFKRSCLNTEQSYIARNARFKMKNVLPYAHAEKGEYVFIDMLHRQLNLNDLLKKTGMKQIRFLNTGLKIDLAYERRVLSWIERLEEFYAKASLY